MRELSVDEEIHGTDRYIVVQGVEEREFNEYATNMINYNRIDGLLPLNHQNINGQIILTYSLKDKRKFIDVIKHNQITTYQAKLLYSKLIEVLENLSEYFLNGDCFIYDLNYFYVDSSLTPFMIYLPVDCPTQGDIYKVWRDFFGGILYELSNGKADSYYDSLMRYLMQKNFSIDEFKKIVIGNSNKAEVNPFNSAINSKKESASDRKEEKREPPIVQNVKVKQEENKLVQKPVEKKQDIQENGFLIPGGSSYEEEPSKKPKKESLLGKYIKKKDENKLEGKVGKKQKDKGNKPAFMDLNLPGNMAIGGKKQSDNLTNDTEDEEWNHTMQVLINLPEVENKTVCIRQNRFIIHDNNKIAITHFPFSVGRRGTNYVIANPSVSSKHVTLWEESGDIYLVDENSSNHTYVNGALVQPGQRVFLKDGDVISMANEKVIFSKG